MSIYPEMSSSTYRTINGIRYLVRQYGLDSVVYEEILTPIPTIKTIHVLNDDGTENEDLLTTIPI